jgi:hypothetical protein
MMKPSFSRIAKTTDGGVASSATPTDGAQRADDNDERAARPAAVAVKIRD